MVGMSAKFRSFCSFRPVLILALLAPLIFLPTTAFARDLVFGYVPDHCQLLRSPEQADKFVSFLEKKLGRSIRARVFKDEQNLQHWMNLFREVDLAVVSQVHIAENGRGAFIPLTEYLLESSNNLGLGTVVGRRGLPGALFFQTKQVLLAAASDPDASEMLDSLHIAGFVIPRQPQINHSKPFKLPPKPCIPDPLLVEPIAKKPFKAQPSAPLPLISDQKVEPVLDNRQIEIEILSPVNDGKTGPQPLLQYSLKNASARVFLDGKVLHKGPGDRLGPLRDGLHELVFEIKSPQQKTELRKVSFQVDATPPDLSIDQPQKVVSATMATMSGSREKDSGIVVLNDAGLSVGSVFFPDEHIWQVQVSQLNAGTNNFQVVARDRYGNEQRRTVVVEVDLVPPKVAIIAPVDGSIVSGAPALAFSAEEGEVAVLVDGEPVSNVNQVLSQLDDGAHVIVVKVQDPAGNLSEAISRFQLDRSGPGLAVDPVAAVLAQNEVTLSGTREPDSKLALSLEPATLSAKLDYPDPVSWRIDLARLVEGENVVALQARDAAGNITSQRVVLNVDLTAPIVSIISPAPGSVHSASPLFDYQSDSELVQVRLDNIELSLQPGTSLPQMAEGPHTLVVTATDAAGNTGLARVAFEVDRSAPELTLVSPVEGLSNDPQPVLEVDGEGDFQLFLDDVLVDVVNGDQLGPLTDGEHRLRLTAEDAAGNRLNVERLLIIDTSPPGWEVLSGTQPAALKTWELAGRREAGVELEFSSATAKAEAVVYPAEDSWRVRLSDLAEGENLILVSARDKAGNIRSGEIVLLHDSKPPELLLESPLADQVYSQPPDLSYRVNEGEVVLKLDAQDLELANGQPLPQLEEGRHLLLVQVTDVVGNQTVQVVPFEIDRSGPVVVISQPGPLVSESDPILSFVTDEEQVQVLLDGNPLSINAGGRLPTLSEGEHILRVEALDAAGNVGVAEQVFQVDTTRPVLALSAEPGVVKSDQIVLEGDADPEAVLSARLRGDEIPVERLADGRWRITALQLEDGINTVMLTATDPGGLLSELAIEVVRDSRPPELTITSPEPDQVYNQSPQLVFSVGEGELVARLDDQEIALESNQLLPELADGDHLLQLEVTDTAGNQTTQVVAFRIDRQGPSLTVEPLPVAFNSEFLILKGHSEPDVLIKVATPQIEDACQVESDEKGSWSCTLGPFEEGTQAFTVVATDPVGNQSQQTVETIVDRTPPTLEWHAPVAGVYAKLEAFDYTLSDGELEILLDGQVYDLSGPVPELEDGTHQISIRAYDEAGNQSHTLVALTIDRQAPLVVISEPDPLVTDAQPVFSFVADARKVAVFLDGKPIEIAAGDRLPSLEDGEHTLRIEAHDGAGNLGVAERTFQVDTVRPELSLTGDPGPVSDSVVILSGTTEGSATLSAEYSGRSLSVVRPSPENWTLQVDGLKEGTNQVIVMATDQGGLQTALNIQIVRDSQALPLVLLSPQAQTYNTARPVLEYQLDTSPERLEITLDEVLVELEEDQLLGPLEDGEHRLTVKVWDAAGNLSQVERSFSVDTTAPVFFVDPLPDVVSSSSIRLSGTREPGSFIDVLPLEGANLTLPQYPAENLWEIDLSNVPDGEHELHFSARDQYGNTAYQQLNLKVDSLEPNIRVLSPTAGLVNDPAPELRLEGEGGAIRILLNGEDLSPETDRIGPLEDGEYTLLVTETDAAGNLGQNRIVFQVDTTPPLLDLISPAKGDRTSTNPTLAYEVSEGVIKIQLDGREIELPSGQSLPQLSEGEHVVRLTATDDAGNVAMAQASFTVDGSAPQVIVLAPASGLTPDTTPLLQFRSDRGEVRVLVDGQEVDKRSGMSLDPLEEGEHVVRVEAIDKAGNIGYAERRLVVSPAEPLTATNRDLSDRFTEFSIIVSPDTVPSNYSGDIELRIGPLRSAGETVYIEQWIDANGNGVADTGEQVSKIFKLVDGLASPSRKVPGDLDEQADRMILVRLPLDQIHQSSLGAIQYVLLAMGDSDVAEARFRVTAEP